MCGKLVYLISFVLVLGLALPGPVDATELGHWKLDEGAGTTAFDSSGAGNHGTILNPNGGLGPGGSVWYNDSEHGTVLSFNGDDASGAYVNAGSVPAMSLTTNFTWAFWAKQDGDGTGINQVILGNRYGGTASPLQFIKFTPTHFEYYNGSLAGIDYDDITGGVWLHHAVVKTGTALVYYRDGVESGTSTVTYTVDANPFFIGGDSNGERWRGWIHGVRIYDHALLPAEIKALASLPWATQAIPADGSMVDADSVVLEWSPGLHAAMHDVYVSTSFDDVNTAGTSSGDVYKGRQSELKYPFDPLDPFAAMPVTRGATYYWRIDEVNGVNTWRGDIWSFWVVSNFNYNPNPADEATFVPVTTDLSWSKGNWAKKGHIVYLSTDFATVNNKVPGTIGGVGYLGVASPETVTTIPIPGDLLYNTTYYWRADVVETTSPMKAYKGEVWSFTTVPFVPISDPNLVGWWKLDGEAPGFVFDYSGHDNHGTAQGGIAVVPGHDANAFDFDGVNDYISMDGYKGIIGQRPLTVAAWVKTSAAATGTMVNWGVQADGQRVDFRVNVGRLRYEHGGGNVQGNTVMNDGQWHHVALTIIAGATATYPDVTLYLDGRDDTIPSTDLDPVLNIAAGEDFRIGVRGTASPDDRFFGGLIDEVRLYDRVLSLAEIRLTAGFFEAYDPLPADEASGVSTTPTLDWLAGPLAASHDVYFGTSYADVKAGTGGTFKGNLPLATHVYNPPGALEAGKVYYWKITEVNDLHADKKWEGPVWAFRVAGGAGGLLGSYYNDTSPGGFETFVLSRIDPEINFNWGDPGSPDPLVNVDLFSCRWTGQVEAKYSEDYIFYPATDDGERLWVDGQLVVDQWVDQSTTEVASAPIALVAGQKYDIVMEYYESGGGAAAYLRWSSASTPKQIIPAIWLWPPTKASNPVPPGGSTGAALKPTLSWMAGVYAAAVNGHRVYFDADELKVIARAGCQVNGTSTTNPSYLLPWTFGLEETYYWAVDEVNGVTWPGDVWSFTTANSLVVDDMETYTDWQIPGNNIVEVWNDGIGDCKGSGNETGSTIYDYPTFSFGGVKSMRYDYDNDGTAYNPCIDAEGPRTYKYSKIVAQVANLLSGVGSNWTAGGARSLSLRFWGDPNTVVIEPMWVELTDGDGAKAKVTYGDYDDEDPNDIAEAAWHEWLIDLGDFTDVNDVNVGNVKSIAIGIGDEDETEPYGSGKLYFDDIRLYAQRCVLTRRSAELAVVDYAPTGNPSGDCAVNNAELQIMVRDWLQYDYNIEPVPPNPDGLMAWYEFEDDANDSSLNGNDGILYGGPTYAPGYIDKAISLDGVDDLVDCGYDATLNITGAVSVSAWINVTTGARDQKVAGNQDGSTGGYKMGVYSDNKVEFEVRNPTNQSTNNRSVGGGTVLTTGVWYHVVGVYSQGNYIRTYVNGKLDRQLVTTAKLGLSSGTLKLGREPSGLSSFFSGKLDDVRVYNYALTEAEIMSLAGAGAVYVPVTSPANISDLEPVLEKKVNFKDYSLLANKWLEEELFP